MAAVGDDQTNAAAAPRRIWGLRVRSRTAWAWGIAYALVVGGVMFSSAFDADAELEFTPARLVLAGLLLAASAWGVAVLVGRPPRYPHAQRRGLTSAAIWLVVIVALQALHNATLGSWPGIGDSIRLFLAAPFAALLLAAARRTGLGIWTTRIAIYILVGGLIRPAEAPRPEGQVISAAGASELQQALRNGQPTVLLGVVGSGATPREPRGDTCRTARVIDARRTWLGLVERELQVEAQACWDRRGRPSSLEVSSMASGVDGRGGAEPISALGTDPFITGRSAALSRPSSSTTAQNVYEVGGPNGLLGASGRAPDDGDERNDTVLVRTDRTGRHITVLAAWEFRDPLVEVDSETAPEPMVREYGPRTPTGTWSDAVRIEFDREATAEPWLIRTTPRGRTIIPLGPHRGAQQMLIGRADVEVSGSE
jgi:hypothetical protein